MIYVKRTKNNIEVGGMVAYYNAGLREFVFFTGVFYRRNNTGSNRDNAGPESF